MLCVGENGLHWDRKINRIKTQSIKIKLTQIFLFINNVCIKRTWPTMQLPVETYNCLKIIW